MYELSQLSHLDTILLRETNIDNVIGIRAEVEALRVYAVNIGKSKDKCQEIAMARIKAERRAGQLLLDMPKRNGARPSDAGFTEQNPQTIKGIKKSQINSWQTIAKLPDDLFDKILLERFQSGDDITTKFFYTSAKIHTMRQRGISTDRPYAPPQTIAISTTDMTRAAAVIRDNLSEQQVNELVGILRKDAIS